MYYITSDVEREFSIQLHIGEMHIQHETNTLTLLTMREMTTPAYQRQKKLFDKPPEISLLHHINHESHNPQISYVVDIHK